MDSARPNPEATRLEAGTVISNYVVEDFLGQGSEGSVYLARDSLLGRQVALKTLRVGEPGETRAVEEARVLAALEHPHVVRVYHAKRHQGIWYVAFEYLSGGSLQSLLQRIGPLPTRQALEFAAQAASGLAYAHEAGFLHRDVKPQNMLLSKAGELKLADFGLALDVRGERRSRGFPVGTPAFLAPELWTGAAGTSASDVFSLGACLFFFLTGRLPFVANNSEQLKRAHLELDPKLPVALPSPVRDIVLAMMAKDPEARPPSSLLSERLGLLARNPYRRGPSESMLPTLTASDPFVDGGAERALQRTLRQGRDRAYLSELASALRAQVRGIELMAPSAADALLLLSAVREELSERSELAARLTLPKPNTELQAVIERKLGLEPSASLAESCQHLLDGTRELGARALIEIYAPRGIGQELRRQIEVLADAAGARGILCVIVMPRSDEPAFEGFRRVEVFAGADDTRELEERMARFVDIATGKQFSFSRDALRLACHVCREKGRWWARVAQDGVLIAAGSGQRVVASWAVLGACEATTPWHSIDDVPAAWRKKPPVWPTREVAEQLARLRATEKKHSRAPDSDAGSRPQRAAADKDGLAAT